MRSRLRAEARRAPDSNPALRAALSERTASKSWRSVAPLAAVAGVGVVMLAGGLFMAEQSPGSNPKAGATSGCIVDPGGDPSWTEQSEAASDIHTIGKQLSAQYGSANGWLSQGIIGVALDDGSRRVIVVVDPSQVDVSALQTRLADAASGGTPILVQAGCHSASDLAEAGSFLANTQLGNASFELSPYDSTWHVFLSKGAVEVEDRLSSRFGNLVHVELTASPGERQ